MPVGSGPENFLSTSPKPKIFDFFLGGGSNLYFLSNSPMGGLAPKFSQHFSQKLLSLGGDCKGSLSNVAALCKNSILGL